MSVLTANERTQLDDVFLSIDSGNRSLKQIKKFILQKIVSLNIFKYFKAIKIKKQIHI